MCLQVYKGKLMSTGEEVALKVQRPGIGEQICVDMVLLRRLMMAVDTTLPRLKLPLQVRLSACFHPGCPSPFIRTEIMPLWRLSMAVHGILRCPARSAALPEHTCHLASQSQRALKGQLCIDMVLMRRLILAMEATPVQSGNRPLN